jgi:hypothetical protein
MSRHGQSHSSSINTKPRHISLPRLQASYSAGHLPMEHPLRLGKTIGRGLTSGRFRSLRELRHPRPPRYGLLPPGYRNPHLSLIAGGKPLHSTYDWTSRVPFVVLVQRAVLVHKSSAHRIRRPYDAAAAVSRALQPGHPQSSKPQAPRHYASPRSTSSDLSIAARACCR